MATVLVGCRLPNGLLLHHPDPLKRSATVKLKGVYEPLGNGLWAPPRRYATTEVDADFWAAWKAAYVGSPILKARSVFEAKDEREAAAKAKDADKTGFEGISQTALGVSPDKGA